MRASRLGLMAMMCTAYLLVAAAAGAQTRLPPQANRPPADEGIGIGILGGWTNSTLRGSPEDEAFLEPRNDFMLGGWVGGNRWGRLGFLGEINFVTKGANDRDFDGSLRIRYLEIPALLRVNIGSRTREGARFYGLAGPTLGFRLNATLVDPEGDLDVTPDYAAFDFGLLLGGGVEVRRIGVELRLNWGLRQLFEPSEGLEPLKNFQIQVVGKYRFN